MEINQHIYLNHASISPLQEPVRQAMMSLMDKHQSGNLVYGIYMANCVERIKLLVAELIHSTADSITLQPNTATCIYLFLNSLNWKPSEEVLLVEGDFPSVTLAGIQGQRRGQLKAKFIPKNEYESDPIEALKEHLTPSTKVFLTSLVGYMSGIRFPVEAMAQICKTNGTLIGVDGTQAIGVTPFKFNTSNIDMLAVSTYKWLMCPLGTAFMAVSPSLLPQLEPSIVGWQTQQDPFEMSSTRLDPALTAQKFEGGGKAIYSLAGTEAALTHLKSIGFEHLSRTIRAITYRLKTMLIDCWPTGHPPDTPSLANRTKNFINNEKKTPDTEKNLAESGIISMYDPNIGEQLFKHLTDNHVKVTYRLDQIRFSPHVYTTDTEIETVKNVMANFSQK